MTRIGPTRLRILGLVLANRRQPSMAEIAEHTGTTRANVRVHLAALQKAGLITRQSFRARTLRPRCRFIPEDQLERSNP